MIALAMANCGGDDTKTTGTEQVPAPVTNSGPQTEMERANEAVEKDSTHQEEVIGKDEKGADTKSTDSTKKR